MTPSGRVGIDVSCLETARTGVGTFVAELAGAIEALGTHELLRLQPGRRRGMPNTRVAKASRHLRHQWWLHAMLPRRAARLGCQVVIGPEYEIPRFPSVPTVPVFHDAAFWTHPEHYNPAWRWMFDRLILPAVRKSPVVLTVSDHSKGELVERLGLLDERIWVVRPGPKRFVPPDAGFPNTLGLTPGAYILHVGVLEKRKNLVRLIRAFAATRARVDVDLSLVLCGQSAPKGRLDDTSAVQSEIARLGLESKVVMPGFLPDSAVASLYADALFTAVPSFLEGFGLPVLESFSYGTPVVCSNSGALREVGGEGAIYFDPLDEHAIVEAMVSMAADRHLRDARARAGREQLNRFSWAAAARRTLEACDRAIECWRAS